MNQWYIIHTMMSTTYIDHPISLSGYEVWRSMIFNLETLEKILAAQREEHKGQIKTQTAMAAEMKERFPSEVKVTQSRYSEMEAGHIPFRVVFTAPQHRLAALRLYGFTDKEIANLDERFDLAVGPFLVRRPGLGGPSTDDLDHVGTVSAGTGSSGVLVSKKRISAPSWVAEYRLDPDMIFVADVDGDSMTCEIVAKTIPQGARAYFHRPNEKMQPRPGSIVYVYLQAEDAAVLKVYQPGEQFTVLTSHNKSSPPIVVDESNPGIVQGIYLVHEAFSADLR